MVMKHIPGPWKVKDLGLQGCLVTGCDAWLGASTSRTREENLANAKLLAAAPELLTELTSLLDGHEAYAASEKNWPDWDEYDRMMYPRWLAAKELLERLKDD
jgi:hypothetical protein